MLHRSRVRRVKGKVIGHDYKNSKACSFCSFKEQCSKSPRGRSVFRYADQGLLDPFDVRVEQNKDKYKLRQMIVEHPFGTIKRSWGAYYFLTRGKLSVTAEMSLTYLAYNLKRAMNVLGVKEIIKRLTKRKEAALI